ncbi:MobC family plasmid mobilization relaxosome protein [Nocardia otitidiscaviarum]|uniref:MobC family plasmid mobilization relaxosome protein n=1 Tax=Nocardia otitidiscaviarum TaxID=1823 RepID=UPI001893C024|nr:MobC family plasmid mobilization relaxosome protein [Nocardia otitidiscaviarum]MBF6138257.1 MobC family plasmid mobilization relaxosome protein [Nocardia otitidiscaviarum]
MLSESEFATVRAAADEAGMTVPWYLVQSAVNPVPATAAPGKAGKPWLPWPKRQTLAALLVSATGALDEVRLEHLAKIGGNLNQIAHAANISGTVADEVLDTVEELRETLGELRERAARMEELARDVTRR